MSTASLSIDRVNHNEAGAIARAYGAFISYPRLDALHREISRCQQLSRLANEPQCMALEGATGTGKTTLIRHYAAAFPRTESATGSRIPVLYVETPSPIRPKWAASAMLECLGDPAADRGTFDAMNARLVKLLGACAVELVILDDFHHVIDRETNRILALVSDWLKVLIKNSGVPFLVVGIDGQVERILRANDQLSRLFAARETLAPFTWDTADADSVAQFGRFVLLAERAIGLPLTTALGRAARLGLIYDATGGVVANAMNLLRYAQLLALERGGSAVEMDDLRLAFEKRLAKHLAPRPNPFVAPSGDDRTQAAVAPTSQARTAPAMPDPVEAVTRRSRRRAHGPG
jgi:energy-coupling factor transporter ATP-binding protein EcfA2